jgi:hypothetical protein
MFWMVQLVGTLPIPLDDFTVRLPGPPKTLVPSMNQMAVLPAVSRHILLHCGDHDPGGLHISEFLHSNLEELAEAVDWDPADW